MTAPAIPEWLRWVKIAQAEFFSLIHFCPRCGSAYSLAHPRCEPRATLIRVPEFVIPEDDIGR
jgi:hypothetical protein